MSSERHRLSKSERAHIRQEKARIRAGFAPSGDQLDAAKLKAQARLAALSQSLTDLLNDKDFATLTDSSQTQYALGFVERT
jgi:hypothetical protein